MTQEVEVWEAEEKAKAARGIKSKAKQQKMTFKPKKVSKKASSEDEDEMDFDSDDSDFAAPTKGEPSSALVPHPNAVESSSAWSPFAILGSQSVMYRLLSWYNSLLVHVLAHAK